MKRCYNCGQTKENSFFAKNKSRKDGLQSKCRDCDNRRNREYFKENRSSIILKIRGVKSKHLERNREFIINYLKENSCVDCGNTDIRVLEFDHQHSKKYLVSRMVSSGYSLKTIKNEIEKCEVVCANCHKIRTNENFNYYRNKDINVV